MQVEIRSHISIDISSIFDKTIEFQCLILLDISSMLNRIMEILI